MRLQSNALVFANEARKPQPNRLPSMIVGLQAVLVREALGFEVGLLHLDALAHEERAQILLPRLGP